MNNELMKDLREAAISLREHYEGKRTLKTHNVPMSKPVKMSAKRIQRLRSGVQASQEIFARCLHTSRRTVEKWEQGVSSPTGATAALLALIEKRPEIIEDLLAIA